jgi:hypothetical protein
VISEQQAFAAIDRGTATIAVSLVGRVEGRWRLLGSTAAPAGVPEAALLERLRARLVAADPALGTLLALDAGGSAADLPRRACSTVPAPELCVVAATARALRPLASAAATSGWRVRPLVLDGASILDAATTLADPRIGAILVGASDPPGADERPLIADLGQLVASATERHPELVVILAGGLAEPGGRTEALFSPNRPGTTVLAPSAAVGGGEPLRTLLRGLRGGEPDSRRALATAVGTLADVLQRRVEVVEIGQAGATRAVAAWAAGSASVPRSAIVPEAALLPRAFGDAHLAAVMGWLTVPLDRLRVRDRLRELALAPWGDAAGDGALLRLAAARAALARLLAATPAFDGLPPADLVVASGGAWAVAPAPAVALALADLIRRPGVRALGLDHARLLAPLGTIEDPAERHAVMADLRDDLVVPLGSVVMPAGLRSGRSAGRLVVRGVDGPAELDLLPGGLELVDLPPGERALVELRLKDPVRLGLRTRHVAMEVAGGLGGLLVDLREIPLHLPERLEPRRELLASWQAALWPELGS